MDSVTEFEPVEVEFREGLDKLASSYGVTRMESEPDQTLRERVRDVIHIKRSSEKVERGESLIPITFEDEEENDEQASIEMALRVDNSKLKSELAKKTDEILRLRSIIVDTRTAMDASDWVAVKYTIARFNPTIAASQEHGEDY